MDDSPLSLQRCDAHNLAVGPDGECVLCRREHAGEPRGASGRADAPGRRPRWLPWAVGTACLGIAFLSGIALARPRPATAAALPAAAPHEVQEMPAPPVPDEKPIALADPVETAQPAAPPPRVAAAPPPPQRNYLDEAYAALDKRGLYDTPAPRANATPVPASTCNACMPRRYHGGMRGYGTPATRTTMRTGH